MLEHPHIDTDGFRLRGTGPSRIEGFSDVVFGFALTLIVVSQAVPRTYTELHQVLLGFVPFSICFLLFFLIWRAHYQFFRRYGMTDRVTIWINFALMFTVLFYIYPLKFLFSFATVDHEATVFSGPDQGRELALVYGAGIAAIYLCIAALYGNAWRLRLHLRLNPMERVLTVVSIWNYLGVTVVGLVCCGVALLLPPEQSARAYFSFFLIFVWGRSCAFFSRHYLRVAVSQTRPEDRDAGPHTT